MKLSSRRAKLAACLLLSAMASLGCARGGCSADSLLGEEAALEGNPTLPGIKKGDRAVENRLSVALKEKGPGYKARTRHLTAEAKPKYTNRLILETSPYLLQHAHNPVNWFPWGEAAFERARREGKPIFLSVGYSTCHWCHVMEGESFEDPEIASLLNKHFISIKVDREERPDIDEIYLRAVRVLSGSGGWPMTVVMTPEKEPFFGGTYLPARDGDRGAQKGLMSVLSDLSERYKKDREALLHQAAETSRKIRAAVRPAPPGDIPKKGAVDEAASAIVGRLDEQFGGFGRAPKFPVPSTLGFLLQHSARTDSKERSDAGRRAVELTLDKMASGGIFDHLGGGFHRYATDARWRVPHFEKMLYDNALLADVYLDAYQVSAQDSYRDTARAVLDYLLSEMQSPKGGFYSASDADSRASSGEVVEGHYFTWTQAEVTSLLGAEEAEAVRAYYDVDQVGELDGRNVLHAPRSIDAVAESLGVDPMNLDQLLSGARSKLLVARDGRVAPHIDDKLITGQNGLAISALARGAYVLGEPAYLSAATKAADYVLRHARDKEGRLLRTTRLGEAKQPAFLDDYAFFVQGLLELFVRTKETRYLKEAKRLQLILDTHFWDKEGLGYFQTASFHEEILAREKPVYDGAVPSGNSVTANNLLLLSGLLDSQQYREKAELLFRAFSSDLQESPSAPEMLAALGTYHAVPLQVILVLAPKDAISDPERQKMQELLRNAYLPGAVVLVLEDEKVKALSTELSIVSGKRATKQTTAYVCEHGGCELPARSAEALRLQLKERIPLIFER